MAELIIKAKKRVSIIWSNASVMFIRGSQETKTISVNYSNATGQVLNSGQVLYNEGTSNTPGFLTVISSNNVTLTNSGILTLSVTHYPSNTVLDQTKTMTILQSDLNLSIDYNSIPVITKVEKGFENRTKGNPITISDFTNSYSDFDNDQMAEIRINGSNATGLKYYNGTAWVDYVTGTWISTINKPASSTIFKYDTPDQDEEFILNLTWEAKDSQGNISTN